MYVYLISYIFRFEWNMVCQSFTSMWLKKFMTDSKFWFSKLQKKKKYPLGVQFLERFLPCIYSCFKGGDIYRHERPIQATPLYRKKIVSKFSGKRYFKYSKFRRKCSDLSVRTISSLYDFFVDYSLN